MRDKKLSDIGEIGMLRRMQARLRAGRNVKVGPGDDCAVVRFAELQAGRAGRVCAAESDLLLTSDPVIESVHFTPGTAASAIGRKAIARVLSDVAAMGGEPLWVLVDVAAPGSTSAARIAGIYKAMSALALRFGVFIVGGDLAPGPVLEIHVFCVGRVPRGKAVLRSGARPGQKLFVTGTLGGSGVRKHLYFNPRIGEGRWLRTHGWASAMIDVSDGPAADVRRLADMSRTGAEILLDAVPLSKALSGIKDARAALHHALTDGEDFELLFTVPERKHKAFLRAWHREFSLRCSCIGSMTSRRGRIECIDRHGKRKLLGEKGYEHFTPG